MRSFFRRACAENALLFHFTSGVAYFMSGSELIKASVFESLGDVMSSAILAVTQMRVRDQSDMHLYPTGKKRFTPLGILFFSAFAVSTMISLIIENIEKLFGLEPQTHALKSSS